VATQDLLEQRPGAESRLFIHMSEEHRAVVEMQVRELFLTLLNSLQESGREPYLSILGHLDAFGNAIDLPPNLPYYIAERASVRQDGTLGSRIDQVAGFKRYVDSRHALENSLVALDVEGLDEQQSSDRTALRKALADLTDSFESSPHVALALQLYYDDVLRRPR